jgi:hypothetical protein
LQQADQRTPSAVAPVAGAVAGQVLLLATGSAMGYLMPVPCVLQLLPSNNSSFRNKTPSRVGVWVSNSPAASCVGHKITISSNHVA